MTRETKVGVAVATTFLCLVSLVVASKLRRPDDLMSYDPQEPPPNGVSSPDPPSPVAQGDVKPPEPPPIKPPSLNIQSPTTSFPRLMPDPATPAPLVPTAPPIVQGWPEKKVEPPTPQLKVPSITPDPLVPVNAKAQPGSLPDPLAPAPTGPRPLVGPPEPQRPASKVVVQETEPKKTPTTVVDPLISALPTVPAIEKKQDPLVAIPAPDLGSPKKDPISLPNTVVPNPVVPALTSNPGSTANPPVAVKDPLIPAAPPPLTPPISPPAATSKPIVIGAIGATGSEVPITPPLTPMGPSPVASPPAVGASLAVPAITGRDLPKVSSHSDDVHYTAATDKSFAQLSKQQYGTDKYAAALLEYNRQHLLNRSDANLQQNPPILQPNQAIFYPNPNVLESQYGRFIATAAVGGPPVVNISPPMPFTGSNPPTADATRTYTVPQTQHIFAIAQQTLGSGNQWTEILRLNPTLRTDQDIPAGTVLRLPANARVN